MLGGHEPPLVVPKMELSSVPVCLNEVVPLNTMPWDEFAVPFCIPTTVYFLAVMPEPSLNVMALLLPVFWTVPVRVTSPLVVMARLSVMP